MNAKKKYALNRLKYCLSPFLVDFLRLMRCSPKLYKYRKILARNREWRNRYENDAVLIVGNGPSLKGVDPEWIVGQKVIVMNNFFLAEWSHRVKPVAVCFGEPPSSAAWEDPHKIFEKTVSESYWLHIDNIGRNGMQEIDYQLNYVLPGVEPRLFGEREIDLSGLSIGYQNTGILAIEIALYMGFKTIKLVGFDHDWLASPEFSRHFYSQEKDDTDLIGSLSYLELIYSTARTWEGYYALDRAAKAHNATIVNCSQRSFLDVFERRNELE